MMNHKLFTSLHSTSVCSANTKNYWKLNIDSLTSREGGYVKRIIRICLFLLISPGEYAKPTTDKKVLQEKFIRRQ